MALKKLVAKRQNEHFSTMRGETSRVKITGITGVSLSKAVKVMPVIAVIGIPSSEDDWKITELSAERLTERA